MGARVRDSERTYAKRFPEYRDSGLDAYRFYDFRPRRLKLFDERVLGAGTFVTARIRHGGRIAWERTEIYDAGA